MISTKVPKIPDPYARCDNELMYISNHMYSVSNNILVVYQIFLRQLHNPQAGAMEVAAPVLSPCYLSFYIARKNRRQHLHG